MQGALDAVAKPPSGPRTCGDPLGTYNAAWSRELGREQWRVVVEPDYEDRRLIVVTAWRV